MQPTSDDPGSTIDAEIAELLDQYLTDRERGKAVTKDQWLAQHPQHAERLAECLDAAELFGGAVTGGFDIPDEPVLPESIGDYEILRELGRGGMGVVYEAREKSLDRIVALKVMRFGIVDPKALDRFRREAETAGALHHTNIVPVYATGREGDTSWYAMQRIEGESLAARLNRAREDRSAPELDQILEVGIQAADALSHAHERDVVHRDVKPANLILDPQRRVWLTDFGLARRLVDAGATMTGAILGTPRYMSPEQADLRTTDVDHRSDVYSLGATLYEMATGGPPFDGDDPLKLITRIRYEDPSPARTLRPDLPRDLEVVLQKAMEKDPDRRYQSAAEFADDLRAIRDDHPIHARPLSLLEKTARLARRHQSRLRVAAAAMAATAALIGVTLMAWNQFQRSRLGSFRIRAGGGPYQATIIPTGQTALSEAAIELTVPMQSHLELVAGDYDVMVAPQGSWSRSLRLPVTRGIPSDYRITDQANETKEVSIKNALVSAVTGDDGSAILWRKDGLVRRVASHDRHSWQRDLSAVPTDIIKLADGEAQTESGATEVNFGDSKQPSNFDRGYHFLEDNPLLTQGVSALESRIDLNGDGQADALIAAPDRQALLAVDHQGNTLWSRAYQFASKPDQSHIADPFNRDALLPVPGVYSLQDVGDRDGDGIDDLFAMFAHTQLGNPTDVCYATLSGKTGDPIAWTTQVCVAAQNRFWPADGIFHPDRYQYRSLRGLGFSSQRAYRNSSRNITDFFIRHQPSSRPIRLPIPSPPLWMNVNETAKVVQLTGDLCSITDWPPNNNQHATTVKLPFMPARAPTVAETANGPRLIFHDHDLSQSKNQQFSGTMVAAYDLTGTPAWSLSLLHIEWRNAIDRNHADWPLVADLNGDGNDEIALPRSRYLNGVDLGLQLYDASGGKPIWPTDLPFTAMQTADDCIARITASEDIDGDGWRDLATATIAGTESTSGPAGTAKQSAYVYVDWISGQTGAALAWARHAIPMIGDEVRVVEIDAIRGGFSASPDGTIEIDLVTGDRTLDNMLATAVVRFSPSQPGPIAMASGLDVCGVAKHDDSTATVYRRRGGPFGIGEDFAVVGPRPDLPDLRLGESTPLASWQTQSGQTLLAATGFQPQRMSVIDAETRQTLWSSDRSEAEDVEWIPIRRDKHNVDFLLRNRSGQDLPPKLIDGESGTEIFQMSAGTLGHVIWSRVTDDGKSMLLVGDGRITFQTSNGRQNNAFQMSMVSLVTGEVRWAQRFLYGASRNNYPQEYGGLRFADLTGDGTPDVIGANSHDGELYMTAWDGTNGDRLWERPVFQRPTSTDYWIPFTLVAIDGQPHVVYLGRPASADETPQLLLCDAQGNLLSQQALEDPARIPEVDEAYADRYLTIGAASDSMDQPQILIGRERNRRHYCQLFDLADKTLRPVDRFEEPEGSDLAGMWLRDIDGDGVSERLLINRVTAQQAVGESTQNELPYLELKCFSIHDAQPRFVLKINDAANLQKLRWHPHDEVPISWLHVDEERLIAVDWAAKRIVTETTRLEAGSTNHPIVVRTSQQESLVAVPTFDGIEFQQVAHQTRAEPLPALIHQHTDPRRVRDLFALIGGSTTLSQWILQLLRGGFALGVLAFLPLWYIVRSFKDRRWSLAWLLLLPVIVGMWIIVWQMESLHQMNLVLVLLNGLTLWMCVGATALAIRGATDGRGYAVRLMLTVGTPFVFLAFLFFTYLQRSDPTLQYTFDLTGLVRIALLSFTLVVQLYWMLRIAATVLGRLRDPLGRRVAT